MTFSNGSKLMIFWGGNPLNPNSPQRKLGNFSSLGTPGRSGLNTLLYLCDLVSTSQHLVTEMEKKVSFTSPILAIFRLIGNHGNSVLLIYWLSFLSRPCSSWHGLPTRTHQCFGMSLLKERHFMYCYTVYSLRLWIMASFTKYECYTACNCQTVRNPDYDWRLFQTAKETWLSRTSNPCDVSPTWLKVLFPDFVWRVCRKV